MRQFGIITTGGDCPGLNAVIYSIYQNLKARGAELIGIHQNSVYSKNAYTVKKIDYLDPSIIARPGTFLGSIVEADIRYFHPERFENMEVEFAKAIEPFNIEGLFVLGGDGSVRIAQKIYKNLPFIVIPKTIDNDVAHTDYAIGFRSAIETVVELLDDIRSTGNSHKRVMTVEVMGRDTGFIALEAGIASVADAIFIPEKPCDMPAFKEFIMQRYEESNTGALVVIAEGIACAVKEFMKNEVPLPSRHTQLGHLQRGGKVSAMDRLMAAHIGSHVVDLAMQNTWQQMVVWRDHKASHVKLSGDSVKRYVTDLKLELCEKLRIFI